MSELEALTQSVKSIADDNKKISNDNANSFKEEASKNSESMFSFAKDLASYFENQKEESETLASEIKDTTEETEEVGRKVENTNSLIQNSINIQNQMLAQMGETNATLNNLFNQMPMWLKESGGGNGGGGGGGLAGLLGLEGLEAFKNLRRNKINNPAIEEEISKPAAADDSAASRAVKARSGLSSTAVASEEAEETIAATKPNLLGRAVSAFGKSGLGKFLGFAGKVAGPIADISEGVEYGTETGSIARGASAAAGSFGGRLAGGWAGAEAGAALGAAAGAPFAGVGAVPGAILGGVIGGFGGQYIGSKAGGFVGAKGYDVVEGGKSPVVSSSSVTPSAAAVASLPPEQQNVLRQAQSSLSNTDPNNTHPVLDAKGAPVSNQEVKRQADQIIATQQQRIAGVPQFKGFTAPGGIPYSPQAGSFAQGGGLGGLLSTSNFGGLGQGGGSSGGDAEGAGRSEFNVSRGGSGGKTGMGASGEFDYDLKTGKYSHIGSIKSSGKDLIKNQQEAYNSARKEGLSEASARALVANMSGESLKNPENIHWDRTHMSQGIVQWDTTRSARIAKEFGKEPRFMSVAEQTKAAIWEAKTFPKEFPGVYKTLMDPRASQAEKIHSLIYNYEKPANKEGETLKRAGIERGLNVKEGGDPEQEANIPESKPGESKEDLLGRVRQKNPNLSPGQCVALVEKMVGGESVTNWRRGKDRDLRKGDPISTFEHKNPDGSITESDKYDGGKGVGVQGAGTTHAGLFDHYNTDPKTGKRTGITLVDQWMGKHPRGPHYHSIDYNNKPGEYNAKNYHPIDTADGNHLRNVFDDNKERMAERPIPKVRNAPQPTPQPRQNIAHNRDMQHPQVASAGGHYGGKESVHSDKGTGHMNDKSVSASWASDVLRITHGGQYGVG